MEHTKGKWEVELNRPSSSDSKNVHKIRDGSSKLRLLAEVMTPETQSAINKEEAEANARRIVQCVNSHDGLVEALKAREWIAMDTLAKFRCPTCMNSKKNGHRHDCKFKAALAEAEKTE